MLLSLVMLLLLVALFLSCSALVGFAEHVIGPQGQVGRGDEVSYGASYTGGITGFSGDLLVLCSDPPGTLLKLAAGTCSMTAQMWLQIGLASRSDVIDRRNSRSPCKTGGQYSGLRLA